MTAHSLLIPCCLLWLLGISPSPALTAAEPPAQMRKESPEPEVRALVERYARASLEEKQSIYSELLPFRAWREMLALYINEPLEVRSALEINIHGIATAAAREALVENRPNQAREFLEMAAFDAEGLLSLAAFHRGQGTLDVAKKQPRFSTPDGTLALALADGQFAEAEKIAEKSENQAVRAAMAMLQGDPLPWMDFSKTAAEESASPAAYLQAASQRWQGKPIADSDFETLRKLTTAENETAEKQAIISLFVLGKKPMAEARLQEFSPSTAFDYLDAIERPLEALQAHGFSPDQPDFDNWSARLIARLAPPAENEPRYDDPSEPLLRIANFLERRGNHEVLAKAYLPPLRRLAAKDPSAFQTFLEALFSRNGMPIAPQLATGIGIAWAENDEGRWRELRRMAIGEAPVFDQWWDWMSELRPELSPGEKLRGMQAVFTTLPDPQNLREDWLNRAWKAIEAAPEKERPALVFRMYATSLEQTDARGFVRAWRSLNDEQRKKILQDPGYQEWTELVSCLSATGDWREVADLFLGQLEIPLGADRLVRPEWYAYAATSLRRAGNAEKAAVYDAWVEKLALGDSSTNLLISIGYAFGQENENAGKWLVRAMAESPPAGPQFSSAIVRYADAMLSAEKWPQAAAAFEVITQLHTTADYVSENPLPALRARVQADLAHAMAILPLDRPRALALLEASHALLPTDASLADYFFPAVRKSGLTREHDLWFEQSWNALNQTLARFPDCDNLLNSASWIAARALKQLDEAAMMQSKALTLNPRQPAYLDTWAEIQLAKGNAGHAIEWSDRALNFAPDDSAIRLQNARFHRKH
ncbi:MAG: hypothetical protein QM680_04695 [Luteolibacter sp.]